MAWDEYHEAILARIREMQHEIADLQPREAMSFAYLVSRDITDEAARMLVAELLLDYRRRIASPAPATSTPGSAAPAA